MAVSNGSEKVSMNKKKVVIYLFIFIGLVLIFLFILMIKNAFTKSSTSDNASDNTTIEQQEDNSSIDPNKAKGATGRSDFDKLINSSRPYNPQYQTSDDTKKGNIVIEKKGEPPVIIANPYQNQIDERTINSGIKNIQKDPLETYKEQEKLRGLMSNRSNWNNGKIMSKNETKNKNLVNSTNPTNSVNSLSLDEKRQNTRAKIEETENKLAQMQYYQQTGQMGKLEQAAMEVQNDKVNFKAPPVDIVGYTKENIYEADTQGKHKIPVGTVIPALTIMKTVSDYQGTFKAMIDHDIYDSTYQYILLPKGTEFMIRSIKASNVNEVLENRMGYTVTWAILPNGSKIDFSKSSGLDREGIGAVKDEVNYHFLSQFFGVAAYAMISNESSRGSTNYNSESSFAGDFGEGVRSQAKPLAQKYINVVPTVTINAGQPIRIIVENEIYVDAWRDVYAQYY